MNKHELIHEFHTRWKEVGDVFAFRYRAISVTIPGRDATYCTVLVLALYLGDASIFQWNEGVAKNGKR